MRRGIIILEELIILGNGFDISCGLRSRYADFYRYRYTEEFMYKIDRLVEMNEVDLTNLNFWDVVLAYYGFEHVTNADWKDIESILEKYLRLFGSQDFHYWRWIDYLDQKLSNAPKNSLINQRERSIISVLASMSYKKYKRLEESVGVGLRKRFVYTLLLEELKKYETAFYEYLNHELENNHEYINKCNQKISALIDEDKNIRLESSPKQEIKILTFNYTSPFQIGGDINISGIKNVHGSLERKNIVFGIDAFNETAEKFGRFTKTYRTLSMTGEYREKLYTRDLRTIKIFGHSLGDADYSYFQSIFDGIDLYGGDTKVIFYYSRFHENEVDNDMEQELQHERVTNLFKRYGGTRGNEYHGKNILHKLTLEGRISIISI